MLRPCGIKKFYTDNWGSYAHHIDNEKHKIEKRNTQRIKGKNLTLSALSIHYQKIYIFLIVVIFWKYINVGWTPLKSHKKCRNL